MWDLLPKAITRTSGTQLRRRTKGAPGWGKRAAHNRAQIMYYIAENLELRLDEIASRIVAMTGRTIDSAKEEVHASINR